MSEGCRGCCLALVLVPLACLALVVCGLIYVLSTAPDPPISENFTPDAVQAQAFENQIQSASRSNPFLVIFDERELSSWLALKSQEFSAQRERRFPIENIQVGLDNNRITFYGEFVSSGLNVPIEVIIVPRTARQGELTFDIEEAHLGGLNIPRFVVNNMSVEFQDALDEPFRRLGDYASSEVQIENGEFRLRGTLR